MNKKKNMNVLFFLILQVIGIQAIQDNRAYNVKVLTGNQLEELMPFVTTQRILAFSSYPYLYAGNFANEVENFKDFAGFKDSAIVIAYHGETPVGLLTGCSLPDYWTDRISDFKKMGIDLQTCYYVLEIIVVPEYRGKKLSPKLITALESHAKNLGYEKISLVTESHTNHALKPDNYKSLDSLWKHFKYKKTPLKIYSEWRTYQPDGTAQQEKHKFNFWIKNLER